MITKEIPNAQMVTEDFEMATLSLANNYRAALIQEFLPHLRGNVLEVGAGIGQITEGLVKIPGISRLLSVEPHPAFYRELLQKFPNNKVIHGVVDDAGPDNDWDAIVNFNVLEHIQEDELELKKYHDRLLKNKGTLCLFVPARPEIFSPLDKDFGHFRRYTRPELRQKLERAGFEIVRMRYYNFVGYFAWGLMFRILKKRHFNAASVLFFDRYIFPPVHGFESRICPPFFGQSLLVAARAK
jgi:SAM-dependent methyltransferase